MSPGRLITMRPASGRIWRTAVSTFAAGLAFATPAVPQDGAGIGGGLGGPGAVELRSAAETLLVDTVEVRAEGSTGDPTRDAEILRSVRGRITLVAGDRLSSAALDLTRAWIAQLDGVTNVRPRLATVGDGARTRVTFEVSLAAATPPAPALTGMLAGDGIEGLPGLM